MHQSVGDLISQTFTEVSRAAYHMKTIGDEGQRVDGISNEELQ